MKRAKWKGPFIKNSLESNVDKNKLTLIPRNYEICSKSVGLVCNVYSGKKFLKLILTEDMIGHKAGEFIPTREKFEQKKNK